MTDVTARTRNTTAPELPDERPTPVNALSAPQLGARLDNASGTGLGISRQAVRRSKGTDMKQRLSALAMVAAVSFLCGGWLLNREPSGEANLQHQSRVLETVLSVIYDHSLDSPNRTELFENTARTLVGQLKDPYAELLVGDGYRQFNRQMSGTGASVLPGGDRSTGGDAARVPATSPGVLLAPTVGYVALHTLSEGAAQELATEIWSLRKQGMRTLLLDLRNNPGGLIKQGVQVADLFLNEGDTIATTLGRKPAHTKAYVGGSTERWPGLMVAVLVNDGTASSAELIAAALQDHDRVVVVGTPTYGKGVLQTTYPLGDEVALKLTTARWFTPSGRSVQRLRPDSAGGPANRTPALHPLIFRTDAGRPIPDASGILPDLTVRTSLRSDGERMLGNALGDDLERFHSAVAGYAADLRANGSVTDEAFQITPVMREGLFARLQEEGINLSRDTFESALPYVDEQLGYEIARELFGTESVVRRQAKADRQLQAALRIVRGSRTQQEALTAAVAAQTSGHSR